MSENISPLPENKSNIPQKSFDVVLVGVIGGLLTKLVKSIAIAETTQENLILLIPGISAGIVAIGIWVWEIFKPENSEKIRLRKIFNKKISEINKQLDINNKNLTDEYKDKLREELGKTSIALTKTYEE